ncbi:MAG TPA: acyl-CoA dehydrogenase family protein, partial [Mycobacterium sp.]
MVATVTDEQFAARELVRDWARNSTAGPGGTAAIREVEQGEADAWRPVFARLADLGIFGVAVPEDAGGAGGSIDDLCAMVEETAKALVPGPVATTALATLVVRDPELLDDLASGERFAGLALDGDVEFDGATAQASGTADFVLGASNTVRGGVLLLPAGDHFVLVDTGSAGVQLEPLQAADFSRPLARVVLKSAPATVIEAPGRRVEELAATVLAA